MKRAIAIALVVTLVVTLLAGCGGRMELGERSFVLGVAVDLTGDMIELTSQIYKPSSGIDQQSGSVISLVTRGETLFEAVREITLKLGRKAQWSHMQSLLIGQELAESELFKHSIDFFYRDHEPRLTTPVMITKGRAARILDNNGIIETSISRQLRQMQSIGFAATSKVIETDLLTLNKEMKKEVSTIVVSMLRQSGDNGEGPVIHGGALLLKGKMVGEIEPEDVQSYLILTNAYRSGIIAVGCPGNGMSKDSVEVVTLETKVKSKVVDGEDIHVSVAVNIIGSLGELNCSSLQDKKDMREYEQHVADILEQQLQTSIARFKQKRVDVVGVGNMIHKTNAREWHMLKRDWAQRLPGIVYNVKIKVNITSTGLEVDRPIFHE